MHPLVEVGLLRVDVAVEVNDPEVAAVEVLRDGAHRRVADRVIAAEHDREGAARVDVTDGLADLVEGLLDVRRDGEDVADVADGDRLAQVDAELERVRTVERGDLADALGTEARARAVRGAAVVRGAEDRYVVRAALAHILEVGGLEEGVDAREVGQLAAAERRDRPIDDRVGALQAEFAAARDLALVGGLRNQRLGLDGVARLGAVLVVERHFTAVFVRVERRLGHEGPFSGVRCRV